MTTPSSKDVDSQREPAKGTWKWFWGLAFIGGSIITVEGYRIAPFGDPHSDSIKKIEHDVGAIRMAVEPTLGGTGGFSTDEQIASPVSPVPSNLATQIRFLEPEGMIVGWQSGDTFANFQLTVPARYNFTQNSVFRLKFSNIVGRDALVIFPSLLVYPTKSSTSEFLTHNAVPIRITESELDYVESNVLVTKVVFVRDGIDLESSSAEAEVISSSEIGPRANPIDEADRQGEIICILRMGNVQLEMDGLDDEPITPDTLNSPHLPPVSIGKVEP